MSDLWNEEDQKKAEEEFHKYCAETSWPKPMIVIIFLSLILALGFAIKDCLQ